MPSQTGLSDNQKDLRSRAAARLTGDALGISRASASEALGVLFHLASSPSTAQDALALLHELQVHQIELELQEEELRDSRVELEEALSRKTELYDLAPIGYFTIDAATVIHELNLSGAHLLGGERDALLGHSLDSFLDERNADRLQTLMSQVAQGHGRKTCELAFPAGDGKPRVVHASATRDSTAQRFLLAFTELGEHIA